MSYSMRESGDINVNYQIKDADWFDFIAAADHEAPAKGEGLSNEVEKLYEAIKKTYMNTSKVILSTDSTIRVGGRSFKVGQNADGKLFIYQVAGTPFIVKLSETHTKDVLKALTPLEEIKKNHEKEIVVIDTKKVFEKVPLEKEKLSEPPRKRSIVDKFRGK